MSEQQPYISIRPGMRSGQPTLNGTRLSPEAIAHVVWDGYDAETIKVQFWEEATRWALLTACWYVARYGTPTWRKRWGAWAQTVYSDLTSSGDHDACPWPPTVMDAAADGRGADGGPT